MQKKRLMIAVFFVSLLLVMPLVSASIFSGFVEGLGITGKVIENETVGLYDVALYIDTSFGGGPPDRSIYRIIIENTGEVDINDTLNLKVYSDGKLFYEDSIGGLNIGERVNIDLLVSEWPTWTDGDHILKFFIDSDNIIEESDEGNNIWEGKVYVWRLSEAPMCKDTDGGFDLYVKGSVSGMDASGFFRDPFGEDFGEDKCLENQIREYYCTENGYGIVGSITDCPAGCSDGACLSEVCPTIIAWRIENGMCVSDTGCNYDSSRYTYYDTEEICAKILKGEPKPEPQPIPDICSELLIEHDIENYKYSYSRYSSGPALYSKEGEQVGTVNCCAAYYQGLDNKNNVAYVCPYDNRQDAENSLKWLAKKEGDVLGEFLGQRVYRAGKGGAQAIIWINSNYILAAVNEGAAGVVPEAIAEAYLKKYYSDLGVPAVEAEEERPIPVPVPCGIGRCVPEPVVPIVEAAPVEVPKEKMFYSCSGCELEGKCYPLGYRKEGKYCSDNYEFVAQTDGRCDNNFECESNVCIAGECLSKGFLQKIIEWIKKFFGIEPTPPEVVKCSKLLIEKDIGDYKYVKSEYGESEHTQVPLFSKDGKHLGVVKCCAAEYIHKEKDEGKREEIKGTIVCPYNNREDLRNSLIWILAKEGILDIIDYKGERVFGDVNEVIVWTNNAYLVASGGDPKSGTPIAEEIAEAYLKRYPSDLDITEDDIPEIKAEPGVFCTEEDKKVAKECHNRGGAAQSDPHPDKECEVYNGCIMPDANCEEIKIVSRDECYWHVARLNKDADLCEKITDSYYKDKCLRDVAVTTQDSSVCEKITDINEKEDCYVKIADITKDSSVCEKITDASKKEKCLILAHDIPGQKQVDVAKGFLDEIKKLGSVTLIDFETLPDGTILQNGDRLTGKEWESLGVIFEFPSEDYLQVFGPKYPFNPIGKLSLSPGLGPFEAGGDTHDDLNIIFTEPVKAVGVYLLDLGETDERESITFLDKDNNVIKRISPWPSSTFGNPAPGVFIGLIHEEGISRIEILENTQDGDDIAYDNLYFVK